MGADRIDWEVSGITEAHHRLFVLQWRELFAEDSLDTWQYRTNNVLTLLREIDEVIHVARFDHLAIQAAVPELVEEALASIERDVVIRKFYPSCRETLVALRKEAAPLTADRAPDSRLETIARTARVLHEQLRRQYRAHLIAELRAMLSSDGREKTDQLNLTMSLGTLLVSEGFSIRHLRSVLDSLLMGDRDFVQRFDETVELCDPSLREFTVCFVVRGWARAIRPTRRGSWVSRKADVNNDQIPETPARAAFLRGVGDGDLVFGVTVAATDPYTAVELGDEIVTHDFAAHSFATLSDPSIALGGRALAIDSSRTVLTIAADTPRRLALTRSRDWEARAHALLKADELLKKEDAHHLSATLQYFRLAVTHPAHDVRLVNLWVAAESLARRFGAGSIIARVTTALAPLLAIRNIRRVTKGLCRRLQWSLRPTELKALGLMEGKRIDPLRLLELLKDEPRARQLLAKLDHDPLLRFRLGRFADGALKSGKTAADYLATNHRNIGWQLARIYRVRNAIVHRGEPQRATRQLLQHLETYVWTAIRQVSHELALAEGRMSLSDALEHWTLLYQHARRVLEPMEQAPLSALIEPAQFLSLPFPAQASPTGASSR